MKHLLIKDHFRHILQQVLIADTEFKLQQAWMRKNSQHPLPATTDIGRIEKSYDRDITAMQLNIEAIELTLYLKKARSSFLRTIWFYIRRIAREDIYKIGDAKDHEVTVAFKITRTDAFRELSGDIVPPEYGDKTLIV